MPPKWSRSHHSTYHPGCLTELIKPPISYHRVNSPRVKSSLLSFSNRSVTVLRSAASSSPLFEHKKLLYDGTVHWSPLYPPAKLQRLIQSGPQARPTIQRLFSPKTPPRLKASKQLDICIGACILPNWPDQRPLLSLNPIDAATSKHSPSIKRRQI